MRKICYILLAFSLALSCPTMTFAQKKTAKKTAKVTKKSPKRQKTKSKKNTKEALATADADAIGNTTEIVNVPLDWWATEQDPQTRLYKFVNRDKNEDASPCGFDQATAFQKGQAVTDVQINGDYYLLARNGNSVLPRPALALTFENGEHCAAVTDKFASFLMDFHGRTITKKYDYLLGIGKYLYQASGSTDSTLRIIGIDDKPVSSVEIDHNGTNSVKQIETSRLENQTLSRIPALLQVQINEKYGIMSYGGEMLVPAKWQEITVYEPGAAKMPKALKAICDENTFKRALFFCCTADPESKEYSVFDQNGTHVADVKCEPQPKAFEKSLKKILPNYFRSHDEINRLTTEKIYTPYDQFLARMQQYDATLPQTVRASTLNLFQKAKERQDNRAGMQ